MTTPDRDHWREQMRREERAIIAKVSLFVLLLFCALAIAVWAANH